MLNSTQKKNRSGKKWRRKALYKLMNNAAYGKTMKNFRNKM